MTFFFCRFSFTYIVCKGIQKQNLSRVLETFIEIYIENWVKVTLRSVAGIMHALRGHYQGIFRAWCAHKKSMICSSGHKLAIIRAVYEHLYPPCVLLMLQVCPDNAHLWTSSDLLKVTSFSSLFWYHFLGLLFSVMK